jgi:hypothetical protein
MPAKDAPGRAGVALAFMSDDAVGQHALRLDHANAAAHLARSRRDVIAQFVSFADHGDVHRQIFQRIVARIGHQIVDGIRPVRAGTAAIGPSLTSRNIQ